MMKQRDTHQSRKLENSFPQNLYQQPFGAWLLLLCLLVTTAACGDGKIKRYPVTGTVTIDGKPAEGVRIMFHPVGGDKEFQKIRALAFTDVNGTYELNTFGKKDGCPAGEFQVTATWPNGGTVIKANANGRPGRQRGPDHLKGKYKKKATSGLKAAVTSSGGTFDFTLTTD